MGGGGGKEEEQDGMSVHSPCKAPPSSASSLSKEHSQAELELRFLEALEIYPPGKLKDLAASSFHPKMSGSLSPSERQRLIDDERREELKKHSERELEEEQAKEEQREKKKNKKRKNKAADLPSPPEPKKKKVSQVSKPSEEAKSEVPATLKRRSPPSLPQIPAKKSKVFAAKKGKFIVLEDSPQKTPACEPQSKALNLGGMNPITSSATSVSSDQSSYPPTPGAEKARFPSFAAAKGDDRTVICQQFLEWVPKEEYEAGLNMEGVDVGSYYMDLMVESAAKFAGMWRWASHHYNKARKLEKNFQKMLEKAREEVRMSVGKELADSEKRARSQASRADKLEKELIDSKKELKDSKSRVAELEAQVKEDLRKFDEFQAELDQLKASQEKIRDETKEEVRDSFMAEGYLTYSRLLKLALPSFDADTDWNSEADKLHQWVEYYGKKELLEAESEEGEDDEEDGDGADGKIGEHPVDNAAEGDPKGNLDAAEDHGDE